MKLLIYKWNGYGYSELPNIFRACGISYDTIEYYEDTSPAHEDFSSIFVKKLRDGNFDAVFSFNFFTAVALYCYKENVPYLSWIYDSPFKGPNIIEHLGYPTNHVFFFDRLQVQQYKDKGFDNVYHLPLAANTKRLSQIYPTKQDYDYYGADFSFVGTLHDEKFPEVWKELSPYLQGYLKSLIMTQQKIYGSDIYEELITDELARQVNLEYTKGQQSDLYSKDALMLIMNKYTTSQERVLLLASLSHLGTTKLYSSDTRTQLQNVIQMGKVTYMDKMPIVFKTSKINLNITLKSIVSGIPLRVMDILGSGGFLLSNFQPELAEFFVPDEEVVLYTSIEEALDKANFYLSHDNLRRKIAARAFQKMEREFTFDHQFEKIFRISGLL